MYKKQLITFILITLISISSYAMPYSDLSKTIEITHNSINYSFIPDSSNEAIYYYIPQNIVFAKSSELDCPKFQMIKIEVPTSALQNKNQAGIIQFSLMFSSITALPVEIENILKEKVNKQSIEIKNLSIEASNFAFLNSANKLIQGIEIPSKKFQVIPNGHIPVRIELSKDECNKFEELVTSATGLQVNAQISFTGLTEGSVPLIAKGNLSLLPFMKRQKEDSSRFIKTITPSTSQSFFKLPNLNKLNHFNIHDFSIKVRLANEKGKNIPMSSQQAVVADIQDLVWRDKKKNVRSMIAFSIPKKFQNNRSIIYKCDFKISYKIGKKKKTLKFDNEYPVFNREIPLTNIENFIQSVTFNGEHLTYNAEGKLRAVVITLSWGKKKKKVVGNLSGITPKLSFIVPTLIDGEAPIIKGKLKFIAKKKKTLKYKNILKERGNSIQIENSEWLKNK